MDEFEPPKGVFPKDTPNEMTAKMKLDNLVFGIVVITCVCTCSSVAAVVATHPEVLKSLFP